MLKAVQALNNLIDNCSNDVELFNALANLYKNISSYGIKPYIK